MLFLEIHSVVYRNFRSLSGQGFFLILLISLFFVQIKNTNNLGILSNFNTITSVIKTKRLDKAQSRFAGNNVSNTLFFQVISIAIFVRKVYAYLCMYIFNN